MTSPPSSPEETRARLAEWLSEEWGRPVTVGDLRTLVGGNSRVIYRFEAGGRDLVLRMDPLGATSRFTPGARIAEFEAMRAARQNGVPVPEVLAVSEDPDLLGAPFIVMGHVAGETIPRRILRDEQLAPVRARLAGQCGEVLARLHATPAPASVRSTEGDLPVTTEELDGSRLDDLAGVCGRYPPLELAQRWLRLNVPDRGDRVLVHGDFRNGNLVIGQDGIHAVLDWESSHVGDPLEDLAWLCVRSWRHGNDHLAAGGFGPRSELLAAYEATSGRVVDPDRLRWWDVLATLRWGIGCVINAHYYLTGAAKNLEMAALGRRVAEMEYDLLELLAGRDL